MGWVKRALEALNEGRTIEVRPRGHSMHGRIEDRQRVLLGPCLPESLRVNDAVMVRVRGNWVLHLIKAMQGERLLIGNAHGGINGWACRAAVRGVVLAVEDRPTRAARRVLQEQAKLPPRPEPQVDELILQPGRQPPTHPKVQ